jgi:hypothetical protein
MDTKKARQLVEYWMANRADQDLRSIDEALLVLIHDLMKRLEESK